MPETLITHIQALRETQPTQYGLLSTYHQEAQQALEVCQRNYPCVSQLYETLDEPALDRRMLGNILSCSSNSAFSVCIASEITVIGMI